MTVGTMEIRTHEREKLPLLPLDIPVRAALAAYAKARWPANTVKSAAREWDLSLDEARGIATGRGSLNAIEKIAKHRNGGWAVVLPAFEAVIGQSVDQFVSIQKEARAREAQLRAEETAALARMARDLPAVLGLGDLRGRGVGDGQGVQRGALAGRRVSRRN